MKVTVNHTELATILSALQTSEAQWRTDAGKQPTGPSRDACIQVATELHDVHTKLLLQTGQTLPTREMSEAQVLDPFDMVWNPDDPRCW
jgi:hypothetical protein